MVTVSILLGTVGAVPGAVDAQPMIVAVSGGSLGLSPTPAVGDFMVVTLDGSARKTEAGLDDFSVVDGRGTGDGWTVSVQATQFREWDGTAYVVNGKSLPVGSLSMPAPTVVAMGTESMPPEIAAGPFHIDGASVIIARAARGAGMGVYLLGAPEPLVLTVPASAYVGTYRSELSVSVTSGP